MPVSAPLICPILVGREAELAALEGLLGGRPAGCVGAITGEAGAGKTRLVRELAASSTAVGFRRLAGACTERDRAFPFAPFVDALRQELVGASPGRVRSLLGDEGEAVSALIPEVRGLFPTRQTPGLPPEQEKRRLFEAIAALLRRLASDRPVLLLLEDLHWADPTTLELIELLARRLADARVVVVVTARTDEPGAEVDHCLAALRRARGLVEVPLGRLSEEEVERMLGATLGAPPPPTLVEAVFARTGGNPFFVEELLAAASPSARVAWLIGEVEVPRTVRDTVLRRLAGLDERTLRVAELVAVAGRAASPELLLGSSGMAEADLAAAIEQLVERQLLVEEPRGSRAAVAFRHALTRDAILERLVGTRRRRLHRSIAEALEREGAPATTTAADLAYHYHAAGAWERALAYATRAGDSARAVHATAEALVHYRRALHAASALDHSTVGQWHLRCGQALALLGSFDAARDHLERALEHARQEPDAFLEQVALYDLAGLLASRDYRSAERLAAEALDLARAAGDPRREGLALNRLGNVQANLARFGRALDLHQRALERFESLGDRWGSADCYDLIGMCRYLMGDVPEARAAFHRAAAIFEQLGDVERHASAITSRGLYLAVIDGPCPSDAAPREYAEDARRGLELCRQIGWRAGEVYALVALGCADLGDGRYGDARPHLDAALAIAAEIGHQQWSVIALLSLGLLRVELLDDVGALGCFERALVSAREVGSVQWTQRLEAWTARCRARLGSAVDAATLVGLLPIGERPATIAERRAIFATAEAALATGQAAEALAMCERLTLGPDGRASPYPPPSALVLRARALATLERREDADVVLQQARRRAELAGPRSMLWRVATARARLWRGRDAALAAGEAEIARAEIAHLAGTIDDESHCAAFLASPETRPWVAPRGRSKSRQRPGGLTPREYDVVLLIARGASNREIAHALVLSEKTVEMHVGNCLAKLGFGSRAQLAAWAVVNGLAQPPDPGI